MLFNSVAFLVFFSVVIVLYYAVKGFPQNLLLLGASYFFYGYWDYRFLSLLIGTTLLVYLCARAIETTESPEKRNHLMLFAIGVLLIVLGIFKYFNFFAESLVDLLAIFGMRLGWTGINIILPVGISFFTFQAIGYILDVHRRKIPAVRSFVECAVFISFFPLLLSGPIERITRMLPQIRQTRVIEVDNITRGLFLILFGLFKKIVVADGLAKTVDPLFLNPTSFNGLDAIVVVYTYALQLYCDFSGYSDIARGVARMMGFKVMKNFMTPFYSKSPSEYWTRWHISLSSWVKDYIYLPLALHYIRKGDSKANEAKPHMYSMVLMGLWHGAAWTYILWGIYHGVMLVLWSTFRLPKRVRTWTKKIPDFVLILFYFNVTAVSLLIFRAASVRQIGQIMKSIVTPSVPELHLDSPTFATVMAIPLFLALDHLAFRHRSERFYLSWPAAGRGALYATLFTLLLMGFSNASTQFIYFQF